MVGIVCLYRRNECACILMMMTVKWRSKRWLKSISRSRFLNSIYFVFDRIDDICHNKYILEIVKYTLTSLNHGLNKYC